jgi:hypothetical protein
MPRNDDHYCDNPMLMPPIHSKVYEYIKPHLVVDRNPPAPKSDIIVSYEDDRIVKLAPDPNGIVTQEQIDEFPELFPKHGKYMRFDRLKEAIFVNQSGKLRNSSICAHERKRFVLRWRCLDCGLYV